MAGYNPTSRRLTKQKSHRKDAIKRSSDSYWDIATAGKTAYAIADTANAISTLTTSALKFNTAITPAKQAYEEANIGRKEVGIEPLDKPSLWELMTKSGPDVSLKEESWSDIEPAEVDATAVSQQGYEYSVGELKRIGQEVKAGTSVDTLEGSTWQNTLGTDIGTRDKPRPSQFGKKDDVIPKIDESIKKELTSGQMSTKKKDPNKKSTWDMLGKKFNKWFGGDDKPKQDEFPIKASVDTGSTTTLISGDNVKDQYTAVDEGETTTFDKEVNQDSGDPNTTVGSKVEGDLASATEDQVVNVNQNKSEAFGFKAETPAHKPASKFGDKNMLAKYKGDRMSMYLGEGAAFDDTLNPEDYTFALGSGVGSSVQGGGVQEYNMYNTSDKENTIDYGSMFSVDTSNQFMGASKFADKNKSLFSAVNQQDSLWGDKIRDMIYR